MNIKEEILKIVDGLLSEDQFLVELEIKGSESKPRIVLWVDSDAGLTIDACASISRRLGNTIEEREIFDSGYVLEVSSPGLDTPLKNIRQYKKNIGRNIFLKTVNGDELEGKLLSAEGGNITLQKKIKKKGKRVEMEAIKIPFKNIMKTKVLISFNK